MVEIFPDSMSVEQATVKVFGFKIGKAFGVRIPHMTAVECHFYILLQDNSWTVCTTSENVRDLYLSVLRELHYSDASVICDADIVTDDDGNRRVARIRFTEQGYDLCFSFEIRPMLMQDIGQLDSVRL